MKWQNKRETLHKLVGYDAEESTSINDFSWKNILIKIKNCQLLLINYDGK